MTAAEQMTGGTRLVMLIFWLQRPSPTLNSLAPAYIYILLIKNPLVLFK